VGFCVFLFVGSGFAWFSASDVGQKKDTDIGGHLSAIKLDGDLFAGRTGEGRGD